MSSHVPNIPILGFTTPVVKHGAVSISARLGSGLYVLSASPDVWRGLLSELADIVGIPNRAVLPNNTRAAEKPALVETAPDAVQPAPASPIPAPPPRLVLSRVRTPSPGSVAHLPIRSPERDEVFRAHFRRFISEPSLTTEQVALEAGVTSTAVRIRFQRYRVEAGAPVLRSNGKL